jgi:hypothetical protein
MTIASKRRGRRRVTELAHVTQLVGKKPSRRVASEQTLNLRRFALRELTVEIGADPFAQLIGERRVVGIGVHRSLYDLGTKEAVFRAAKRSRRRCVACKEVVLKALVAFGGALVPAATRG